jgi:hypothetical protein
MKEDLLARLEAKIELNQAKADVKIKETSKEIKSGQVEMRSIVTVWIADLNDGQKERTACQEKMEPNPGMMQSTEEHQKAPKEDVGRTEEAA